MLKKWWINFQAWRACRHYARVVKRSRNKFPRAYRPQGWEFDNWEVDK